MRKVNIGISIDEILRAKWLQFDKYYVKEFGEDGVPEKPYVYNFFENYKFSDTMETIKEMKEPDKIPETLSPLEYIVDSKTGEAPADAFIFKKSKNILVKKKDVFNRFMYEDYLFEIHGAAPMMYNNMDVHVNKFLSKYENYANFIVLSVENKLSIPPTLFFLSKILSRFNTYRFVDRAIDMWKDVDILITTDPELLKLGNPWGKKIIKVTRPYNEKIKTGGIEILQIADLIDNPKFEKIIRYKKYKK